MCVYIGYIGLSEYSPKMERYKLCYIYGLPGAWDGGGANVEEGLKVSTTEKKNPKYAMIQFL